LTFSIFNDIIYHVIINYILNEDTMRRQYEFDEGGSKNRLFRAMYHSPVLRVKATKSSRFRVFTLIELLVVIGIISILASLLLPTLKTAKDMAKEVLCYSNQKQNNLGVIVYYNDFNGWFPLEWTAKTTGENVRNYLPISDNADIDSFEDMNILRCPALDKSIAWGYPSTNGVGTYALSTYNDRSTGISARPLSYWTRGVAITAPVTKTVKPTGIPLIICGYYWESLGIYYQAFGRHYNTNNRFVKYPHNKRVAITFLDGHQESVKGVYGAGDNEIANCWSQFWFPAKTN
jgi:prepilin-type N-terminal cleavage/methylation domain-containing protein/prepilin-type processing-associated H-X9-DG protein